MGRLISLDEIGCLREGKVLVTTNGTFDVLHVAHLRILQEARKLGDMLLVLVNSDRSVKENKGDSRPFVPEDERIELLAGLSCVDFVMKFDDCEVTGTLEKIKPDVHVKGGTVIPERIGREKQFVESWGGRHICLGKIGEYSSTSLIEKIKRS